VNDTTVKRIVLAITLLIVIAVIIAAASIFTGCKMAPKRDNYNSDIAFVMSDCMYRAENNPVVCSELIKAYANYAKEQQQYSKIQFCKDIKNYLPHWNGDSEKCLLYLNQK